jgi:hypothetical protein
MKTTRLLKLTLVTSALACALAPPFRSSAQQTEGRGVGVVQIRAEDGREVQLYEKSYALVIGVSDYTYGWPKLPGVKKDIEEVARALERHGFLVTKVENPDSVQLEKSFKEFIDAYGRGVETRLVFYFAGHGHTVKQSYNEEMGYIVPSDAPLPTRDPAGFMSKAMDMQQMELYARRIQSKHALFLFDSCFSGALFALSRAVPDAVTYKTARPVRQFITSGSADEQVPDQSVFRRQFVEALDGEADSNRDGYVTGTELGEFLQDKVINYSRNAQHPQYGKIRNPNLDKGDFVFALSKTAGPKPGVAAVPAPASQPALSRTEQAAVELAFWDTIKNSTDPDDYDAYLKKFPNGEFVDIARRRVQKNAAAALTALDAAPPDTSAAPTPAASAELPFRHTSPEGRYEILMPAQPQLSTQEGAAATGEKLQHYFAIAADGEIAYMVSYFDYTVLMTFSLDKASGGLVGGVKGKVLSEHKISLGGTPGREVKFTGQGADGSDFLGRARFYNEGRRVYLIQIITPRSSESSERLLYSDKAQKFFDSFQVVVAR